MFTFQALQVLTYLVPGFVASMILDALVVRPKRNDLARVIEAFAFTLIIFAVFSAVVGKSPIQMSDEAGTITFQYVSGAYLWLLGITICLPLLLGTVMTHDLHMRLARWLQISKKTSRTSVWVDVFYDLNDYIAINFADERRIIGWPTYFSHDPDNRYIFLEKAEWVVPETDENGNVRYVYQPIEAQGILITPEMEIVSIEVMKDYDV